MNTDADQYTKIAVDVAGTGCARETILWCKNAFGDMSSDRWSCYFIDLDTLIFRFAPSIDKYALVEFKLKFG